MFYETVYGNDRLSYGLGTTLDVTAGETKAAMLARGCYKVSKGKFLCPGSTDLFSPNDQVGVIAAPIAPIIAGTATGGVDSLAPKVAGTSGLASTASGILDSLKAIPLMYWLIGGGAVLVFFYYQHQKKTRGPRQQVG